MKLVRRQFLRLAGAAIAAPAFSRLAVAQAYPARPVRLIVGFAAGGGARHCGAPHGAMAVGTARPAVRHREPARRRQQYRDRGGRASRAADGYTLLLVPTANASTQRSTRNSIQFHPRHRAGREHQPRSLVMLVNPSLPAKTVPEFIAYAKANPSKINMASPGSGTAPHIAGELFKMMAGINMVHVPYRGGAPRSPTFSAGRCRSIFDAVPALDRAHQSRQAAGAGGDQRDTVGGAAGGPERGRFRAGLRGDHLVRRRRTQEHARRASSTGSTRRSMRVSPIRS